MCISKFLRDYIPDPHILQGRGGEGRDGMNALKKQILSAVLYQTETE
jgi:hypothetical protein